MRALVLAFISSACLFALPAAAQNLTPDDVAAGYVEAVTLCAKAKLAGHAIAQLEAVDLARVAESDPQMRAFAQAAEGRPVWDVLSARGIVVISEPTDSECNVSAYGPRVRPVFDRTAAALSAPALAFVEVQVPPDPSAIVRAFERTEGARRIQVRLDGGEPGMPGRTFRFPMLLAFVRVNQ